LAALAKRRRGVIRLSAPDHKLACISWTNSCVVRIDGTSLTEKGKYVWELARLGIMRCVLATGEIPHEKLHEISKTLLD